MKKTDKEKFLIALIDEWKIVSKGWYNRKRYLARFSEEELEVLRSATGKLNNFVRKNGLLKPEQADLSQAKTIITGFSLLDTILD